MERHESEIPTRASVRHDAADDVELVVLDVHARAPGFYMSRTRTYFVAQDGAVYLVRAPGQPATLQREDDLPPDCERSVTEDEILSRLAEVADLVGRRTLGRPKYPVTVTTSSP